MGTLDISLGKYHGRTFYVVQQARQGYSESKKQDTLLLPITSQYADNFHIYLTTKNLQ